MSHSVLQMIRDFVLAPALLSASLLSVIGAFVLLLAVRDSGLKPGASVTVTAVAYLSAFLLTSLFLVGFGAAEVRLDLAFLRPASWLVTGCVWAGLLLWRTQGEWQSRFLKGGLVGCLMGVAAWAVDAYVVSTLLFVE